MDADLVGPAGFYLGLDNRIWPFVVKRRKDAKGIQAFAFSCKNPPCTDFLVAANGQVYHSFFIEIALADGYILFDCRVLVDFRIEALG